MSAEVQAPLSPETVLSPRYSVLSSPRKSLARDQKHDCRPDIKEYEQGQRETDATIFRPGILIDHSGIRSNAMITRSIGK